MAIYEYRCRDCETLFEFAQPFGHAAEQVTCPSGHVGARRVLSVFATAGRGAPPAPTGGCGANCACAAAR